MKEQVATILWLQLDFSLIANDLATLSFAEVENSTTECVEALSSSSLWKAFDAQYHCKHDMVSFLQLRFTRTKRCQGFHL
jgi:hypothetical protein